MKIIFLDIDGVLNSNSSYKEYKNKNKSDIWFHIPGTSQLSALKHIVDKTDAKVVISSTWRIGATNCLLWECYFAALNCEIEVLGTTPVLDSANRGKEIIEWLKLINNIDSFVVLDDDPFDMDTVSSNYVYINNKFGLTMEDAERAIVILNKNSYNKKNELKLRGEKMKNPFVVFLCVFITLYLFGWYVSLEPNISNWDIVGRGIHIWVTLAVTALLYGMFNAEN